MESVGSHPHTVFYCSLFASYCKANDLGCWKAAINKADRAMAMDFLDHMCERWNIQSEGTSWEYWRQYKQLYASVTGQFVDRNDNREVLKV
jgi:hypothetical protein